MRLLGVFGTIIWLGIIGCSQNNLPEPAPFETPLPLGFERPLYPEDNRPSAEKIALGKKLFFDNKLSKNENISCASCHKPEQAFSDNIPLSVGSHGKLGFRNSPSVVNVAYKSLFHKDGGVRTLELQVLAPLTDSLEMDANLLTVLEYLQQDEEYVTLFQQAFNTSPNIFGITRAIADYERSLIYGNSAYDRFLSGDSAALTDAQKNGLALFSSKKLNCTACHTGKLLTDYKFHNIGLAHQFADSGRARITLLHDDVGRFETPSLRNIMLTAPYMHNGSVPDLKSAINLFENGVGNHPNKSELITPFTLTEKERNDLLQFFEALTDDAFLN